MSRTTTIELAEDNPGVIVIDAPYAYNGLIKDIGGTWNKKQVRWQVPVSWAACIKARTTFGQDLTVGPRLVEWATLERTEIDVRMKLRDLEHPLGVVLGLNPRLYPHQQAGVDFLSCTPYALIGDEMGCGKTPMLISALSTQDATPAIVICPASLKENWAREIRTWGGYLNPYVVSGSAVTRRKVLAAAADDPNAVVIINYESIRSHSRLASYGSIALASCDECTPGGTPGLDPSKCEKHPKELNEIPFKAVIIDEAHRLSNPKSKQTRSIWAVAHGKTVEYRWAATGTPVVNNPADLWSILHTLDPQSYPAKTKYIDRYCLVDHNPFGGIEVLGLKPDMKNEFFQIFDPMFRRMTKERVLKDLPPKIRTIRYADMTPKQARMYKEMDQSFNITLDDEDWISAPNQLAAAMRLMQAASASLTVDKPVETADDPSTWKVHMTDPSNKVDALIEILGDIDPSKPLVACAHHRQLIELCAARLDKEGITYGLVTGTQTEQQKQKAVDDFQNGRIRVLLFTISAGGTGLTLTAADTIVFLQRSWRMVDNLQAEDRLHRVGAEEHDTINIIDVVVPDTIEVHQIRRVHEKAEMAQEVIRDDKGMR